MPHVVACCGEVVEALNVLLARVALALADRGGQVNLFVEQKRSREFGASVCPLDVRDPAHLGGERLGLVKRGGQS